MYTIIPMLRIKRKIQTVIVIARYQNHLLFYDFAAYNPYWKLEIGNNKKKLQNNVIERRIGPAFI